MGVYTTLYKERRCLRCGAPYLADFQFKTGLDCMEHFKDGDIVPKSFSGRGTFKTGFTPICSICRRFIDRELGAAVTETEQLILGLGCEIRETSREKHVFKDGRRVAEMIHGMITAENPRSRDFLKLRDAVLDYWKRHVRSANLSGFTRITCGMQKNVSFDGGKAKAIMSYTMRLQGLGYSEAAVVTVGRRFRLRIVDTKGDPTGHWLMKG